MRGRWTSNQFSYHPDYVVPYRGDECKWLFGEDNNIVPSELSKTYGEMRIKNEAHVIIENDLLKEMHKKHKQNQLDEEERTKRLEEERKKKYAAGLKEGVPMYSPSMGMRNYKMNPCHNNLHNVESIIKGLYKHKEEYKEYTDIYDKLQKLNKEKKSGWSEGDTDELINSCANIRDGWKIGYHNRNFDWECIDVSDPANHHHSVGDIKAYIKPKAEFVKSFYHTCVRSLLEKAEEGFITKISKFDRGDMICFWLRKHEFSLLEEFCAKHNEELMDCLPLMAHREKIAISHDLMDLDTHNGILAKIVYDYLQEVEDEGQINIEKMYDSFVMGWNADLPEGNLFRRDFANTSAQAFVIIIDSLNCVLSGNNLADDSFILSDDIRVWENLGQAKCWSEVEE